MTTTEPGTNPKDIVGAKKAPLALVPQALIIGAAEAMATGAAKYGPYNWRDYPVQMVTYIEAMQRHLAAFLDGEDFAPDSGVHHLHHVAAGCAILLDCIWSGSVIDNRPLAGPAAQMLNRLDHSIPVEGLEIDGAEAGYEDPHAEEFETTGALMAEADRCVFGFPSTCFHIRSNHLEGAGCREHGCVMIQSKAPEPKVRVSAVDRVLREAGYVSNEGHNYVSDESHPANVIRRRYE